MNDQAWKRHERAVAKTLGGKRIPINGRGDQPDVENDWLSVECKCRHSLPTWLMEAMAQAERGAKPGQLPIAVLHQAGERHGRDLVMLRLSDFHDWFGDVGPAQPHEPLVTS